MQDQATQGYGLCKCGCGGKAAIATQARTATGRSVGDPMDYMQGHNRYTLRTLVTPDRAVRIERLYLDEMKTIPQVAKEMDMSPKAVARHLRNKGVVRAGAHAARIARTGRSFDDAEAARMYEAGLSTTDICVMLRASATTVCASLRRQGVKVRSKSEASRRRRPTSERRSPHPRVMLGHKACLVCGVETGLERHHVDANRGNSEPSNIVWMCWEHHLMVEWLVDKALTGIRRAEYCASSPS